MLKNCLCQNSHKILQIFNSPQIGIWVQRNLEFIQLFQEHVVKLFQEKNLKGIKRRKEDDLSISS